MVKFLEKWDRVQALAPDKEDLSFLHDFAKRAMKAASEGYAVPGSTNKYNYYNVRDVSESWINSIQYTQPRGSIDSLESLFQYVSKSFLK